MKNNIKTPISIILRCAAILMLFIVSACTPSAPAATETPTALPPTATAQPTATATIAPTATATPEPTATATITPTPEPSPTPVGFFRSSGSGYSITYPRGWELMSEGTSQLVVGDRSKGVMMIVTGQSEQDALEMDDVISSFSTGLGEGNSVVKAGEFEEVELADGVKATKAPMVMTQGGQKLDMWLIYTHQGKRGYMVIMMGAPGALNGEEKTLGPVLKSLRLFVPQPYDLPRDQTLFMLGGDPLGENIDPATAKGSAGDYPGLLFSGLVRLSNDMRVIPDLAESWEISPDGKVYTFKLREGLKFANGDPITAEDVRKSWERACDPDIKSTTASTYLNDIVGVSDKLSGKADEIKGLKVVDERTLEATLDGAKAYFLAKLTYPTAYVIDTRQPEKDEVNWMFEPNSSGPYQVKEYKPKEALILEKNPNYYQPAGVNNLLFIFEPGGSPLSLYEEGVIDMLPLSSTQEQEFGKADHPLNKQLLTGSAMCTTYMQLNTALAPTDDPLVRKALYLAIDRNQYIEKLTNNGSLLATGILPPGMPGYSPERELPAFDAQAAKDALKESKYAGQALTITITSGGYGDSQSSFIGFFVDQWKKNLGVTVKVDLIDPDKFTETIHEKPGNVVSHGWCADYPDPENFLDVLFHTGNSFNYTNLSDPELDAMLEQARTELDPAKRIALYQKAEDYLLNGFMAIPLSNSKQGILVNPRVKNYVLTPISTKLLAELVLEKD